MEPMSRERWARVDALLADALDHPPDQRRDFLEAACGADAALLREVEALLESEPAAAEALGESVTTYAGPLMAVIGPDAADEPEPAGRRIGAYSVVRELGRGGMGTVYLGERADAEFRLQVAIKVVKRGMDTDAVIQRFRYERQILASLDHPNIARLLDGGVTDDGRPYLVMEYIEGEPIDRYCDTHGLDVEARLALFTTLCRAVQYAHQTLVVHRDIKPSNILVAADGTPRLLDFGIAKLLDDNPIDSALVTRTGMRLLTPEHAAPEQLLGEPVTTATDVYTLGVLLYLLLTGRRPVERHSRGLAELEHALIHEEAARPSQVAPGERRARLRGDLDTIILKALEKEPARRYQSAQGLADDLERHRAGLPVRARPGTTRYRAGKFLRRNRAGVGLAVAAAATIVGFGTFHSTRITRERDLAEAEAVKSQAALDFVTGLFRDADPDASPGDTLNAIELLERGVARLARDSARSPDVQSTLQHVFGSLYHDLGDAARARQLLESALATRLSLYAPADEPVVATMRDLAQVRAELGDVGGADTLYRVIEARLRTAPADRGPSLAVVLNYHGDMLRIAGRTAEADSAYREAAALLEDAPGEQREHIAHARFGLGLVRQDQGKFEEAVPLLRESLALLRVRFGAVHTDIASTLTALGAVYWYQGHHDSAITVLGESLAMTRTLFGAHHPAVAVSLNTLALPVGSSGDFAGADTLMRSALAISRAVYGDDHRDVAMGLNNLAWNWVDRGNLDSAETLFRQGLAAALRGSGEGSADAALLHGNVGMVLRRQGRLAEAEPHMRIAVEARIAAHGEDHVETAQQMAALGRLLSERGRGEESAAIHRRSAAILRSVLGSDDPALSRQLVELGRTLLELGQTAAAESTLSEAVGVLEQAGSAEEAAEARELLATAVAARGAPPAR